MNPELSVGLQVELAIRLTAGLVLGAVIGFERELQRVPGGPLLLVAGHEDDGVVDAVAEDDRTQEGGR